MASRQIDSASYRPMTLQLTQPRCCHHPSSRFRRGARGLPAPSVLFGGFVVRPSLNERRAAPPRVVARLHSVRRVAGVAQHRFWAYRYRSILATSERPTQAYSSIVCQGLGYSTFAVQSEGARWGSHGLQSNRSRLTWGRAGFHIQVGLRHGAYPRIRLGGSGNSSSPKLTIGSTPRVRRAARSPPRRSRPSREDVRERQKHGRLLAARFDRR
jgi:hypothetical protein